jgi:MFS family permease
VAYVRRLLLLVAAVVFVDTMLFVALTPLLPHFTREFGLSKFSAGVLTASYAVGALLGSLPGGFAAVRVGPKRAVLMGLALMGVASIGFALADSFPTLLAERVLQGCGSAFTWAGAFSWLLAAAPRSRRGELIGIAMGAAVVGALFGPVLGAAAALVGRAPIFGALAGVAALLAVGTLLSPAPTVKEPPAGPIIRAFANPRLAGGLALLSMASLLAGILSVLGPLHLAAVGWSASAIGAVWLLSAALEAAASPFIGRASDRRGALVPVRFALVAAALLSLTLALVGRPRLYAALVLLASTAYGILFTPAFALIAEGADRAGLAQGHAFGVMNAVWALGAMVGPVAAGAIAGISGDWLVYVLATVLCVSTLVAILSSVRRHGPAQPVAAPSHRTA